jgi:hypothetical protein
MPTECDGIRNFIGGQFIEPVGGRDLDRHDLVYWRNCFKDPARQGEVLWRSRAAGERKDRSQFGARSDRLRQHQALESERRGFLSRGDAVRRIAQELLNSSVTNASASEVEALNQPSLS